MNLILEIIGTIILSMAQIYSWHKISEKQYKRKDVLTILVIAVYSAVMIIFNNTNLLIKPALMVIIAILLYKILFKETIKLSITTICLNYFIIIISEAIFGFLIILVSQANHSVLLEKYGDTIIADVSLSILIVLITNLKIIRKIYKFIVKHTKNLKSYNILIFLLIIITCSVSGFALTYYNNVLAAIIVNVIITFIYAIIIVIIIKTKNKYNIINNKYNLSLENLNAQENIINEYRILNHENKNVLMTVKGMTTNKKIINYINAIINQKNSENNKILNDTLKLPEGGIRGLIYNKILIMKDNNIKYGLNIDKKTSTKILHNIDDKDIVDICQILGVFIDNAIEECINIENKNINIDLHINDKTMIIIISNNYKNVLKIKNNDLNIKTTKGKGHGYGLQLVKKIISENNKLNYETEITKDTFTQKLYIMI